MALATLETLTPVHIGSGVTYNRNMDFVIDNKQVGIIDERKLLEIIGEENIHQWVSSIENNVPIMDFLQKGRGMKTVSLDKISHEVSVLKSLGTHAQNLKEHYRTSIKGVCIPGSSMKGAIKTAYWNNLVEPILKDIKESELGKVDFDYNKNRNVLKNPKDKRLEQELFGDDPNSNAFRFLSVGDCHFNSLKTEVYEVSILNYLGSKWEEKDDAPMLYESIPTGSKTEFNISIKQTHYDENKKKQPYKWNEINIHFHDFRNQINDYSYFTLRDEIINLTNNKFSQIDLGLKSLNKLHKLLEQVETCNDNEFIIRLGGNIGWEFTTGGWVKRLKMLSKDYKKDLQLAIQKKDRLKIDLWPKTRKVTTTGDIFGFVKITLQQP